MHYPGEKISANCLEVEKSNNFAYVGYENGYLGVLNLTKGILGSKIKGHESSINAIGINITNKCIYTVGSDGALIGWQ